MAHAVAQQATVAIAAVLTKRQRLRLQKGEHLLPGTLDHWPSDPAVTSCVDANQAVRSAAAQEPHQQRLRLVVHRVARGDLRAGLRLGNRGEERIALLPCACFQIGCAGERDGIADDAGHPQGHRNPLRALLITLRLRTTQVVIEVRGAHLDFQARRQCHQRRQQGHRVRAARKRHQHPVAGPQQRRTCKRSPDLLQQGCGSGPLHSVGQFDIIPPAIQMCGFRFHPQRSLCWYAALALITLGYAPLALCADAPEPPPEAGTSHQEIVDALHDLQRKYGSDAVLMEGHLLGQAVRSGSLLEAVISVTGVEERNGKRFLAFKLETGIIYNDRELAPHERSTRAWTDIVEATLRKFHKPSVPADGIAVLLSYTHKPYSDLSDLRAHLNEGHGEPEALAFYVLVPDIVELNADRITAQELIDRSTFLLNGEPARLRLAAPTPSSN